MRMKRSLCGLTNHNYRYSSGRFGDLVKLRVQHDGFESGWVVLGAR